MTHPLTPEISQYIARLADPLPSGTLLYPTPRGWAKAGDIIRKAFAQEPDSDNKMMTPRLWGNIATQL